MLMLSSKLFELTRASKYLQMAMREYAWIQNNFRRDDHLLLDSLRPGSCAKDFATCTSDSYNI